MQLLSHVLRCCGIVLPACFCMLMERMEYVANDQKFCFEMVEEEFI